MSDATMMARLLEGVDVEWKPLGEVATLRRGRVISKKYLAENPGSYPVYSSQTENNGEMGTINEFDFDGEFVSWTTDGANAGTVFHRTGKFSITNVCGLITINRISVMSYKFLYYWLSIEAQKHVYSGMGNPKLMSNQVDKIPIPIPPLPVQAEIVRILDTFTAMKAELEAELEARQQQYAYYRDLLLTFDEDEVEWKTLGEVGELVRGNGLQKKDLVEDGFPAIHYGQIHTRFGLSADRTFTYVSEKLARNLRKAQRNDLLLATTSENDEDVVKPLAWLGKQTAISGDMMLFRHSQDVKYLAYFIQTEAFQAQKRRFITGAKVRRVSSSNLAKIQIPIPPLPVQAEIVRILDQFDTLTNSISEGLPREIELRQKQYDYYRDLLLSFPKDK